MIGLNPENARPEWMIITVLAVPPPCVRPSVTVDNAGQGHDDLTHMLTNIVRYNGLVGKHHGRMATEYLEQLEFHVTAYIDNDVTGLPQALQKGGRVIKSLTSRLSGKEGRIRLNLMGKRVDFSARTVITGDPHLSIEEVGVPLSIARTLTFPERTTNWNIEKLQKLVDNGNATYPGARYLVKESGQRIDLSIVKKTPEIIVGDTVERHMVTGDTILFNRQPSLHKMSMMAHKARVMPYSTFRLNVNACSSYNADFDGDEMNLHLPQSHAAIAELETLSMVSKLLVSAQANKPSNALVQDALCGIRLITSRDVFIRREEFMNLLMTLKVVFIGIVCHCANYFNRTFQTKYLNPLF